MIKMNRKLLTERAGDLHFHSVETANMHFVRWACTEQIVLDVGCRISLDLNMSLIFLHKTV